MTASRLRKSATKTRGRPFERGNPGRPKGARNRATLAAEAILEGEAEALSRKAVERALEGDMREFSLQIQKAWHHLAGPIDLGRFITCYVSLPVDADFQRVALDPTSAYEEIYRTGLSRSNYNILLADYAYFQLSWRNETSWRLAYYPNPWLSGIPQAEDQQRQWETLQEMGALTFEELSDLLRDMPYWGAIPPIRFDYDTGQYTELLHPAAHFHIGTHGDNRWPSSLVLGPAMFVLLIAKLYYPQFWSRGSKLHGALVAECIDDSYAAEVGTCRAVHQFSDTERALLHFGKNMRVDDRPNALRRFSTRFKPVKRKWKRAM